MLEFDPLDEYPIHQVPLPMRYVGPSDRHFYDRCIYQGVDHDADAFFITGLGVYPNLGVIDAFATVRRGDRQWAVRMSGPRPDDKLRQEVGPYRIEVVEPYRAIRLVCDADEHGIGFDLRYSSEYGPISEPAHVRRQGDRILLDASRFAGVGTWSGELRVGGETIEVTPERFTATRDRSWGIRPVGEPEPPGRPREFDGMWWNWIPLRFDDFALHVILEEDPSGAAQHELRGAGLACEPTDADPSSSGGRSPRSPTSRERAGRRMRRWSSSAATGSPTRSTSSRIIGIPLNIGCGYGADPDWTHGLWKGEDWIEGSHVRPQRSGGRRAVARSRSSITSRARRSTVRSDGASSSTATSAGTTRRVSPT